MDLLKWLWRFAGQSRRNQAIAGVAFIFLTILAVIGVVNLAAWLASGGLFDFANAVEEVLLPKWIP